MRQRWIVFLVALAGSAVLVSGVTLAADRLTALAAPAPHLKTVPASVLARSGYSLAAAPTPPYCDAEQQAARRGWAPAGAAGCPITRERAERSAGGSVQESVLARVSGSRESGVGQDRVAWLVVTRPRLQVMFLCVGGAIGPNCPPGTASVTAAQAVVFVDAYSGHVLDVIAVTGPAPPSPLPIRILPVPPVAVPIRPPAVTPMPRPPPVVTDDPSGS
ncbi:MAG TPA: hypothetical protein VIC57_14740 [Candidatus Dormibacteraeota bacterium]